MQGSKLGMVMLAALTLTTGLLWSPPAATGSGVGRLSFRTIGYRLWTGGDCKAFLRG